MAESLSRLKDFKKNRSEIISPNVNELRASTFIDLCFQILKTQIGLGAFIHPVLFIMSTNLLHAQRRKKKRCSYPKSFFRKFIVYVVEPQ
jgi:hypothetical protein